VLYDKNVKELPRTASNYRPNKYRIKPAKGRQRSEEKNRSKKTPKTKVIRDSFSFPEHDYRKISNLKKTCLAAH
jgi:hypothetical protein